MTRALQDLAFSEYLLSLKSLGGGSLTTRPRLAIDQRGGGVTHIWDIGILGGKKSGIWDMSAKKSGIWDMGKSSGIWDIGVEIIKF